MARRKSDIDAAAPEVQRAGQPQDDVQRAGRRVAQLVGGNGKVLPFDTGHGAVRSVPTDFRTVARAFTRFGGGASLAVDCDVLTIAASIDGAFIGVACRLP